MRAVGSVALILLICFGGYWIAVAWLLSEDLNRLGQGMAPAAAPPVPGRVQAIPGTAPAQLPGLTSKAAGAPTLPPAVVPATQAGPAQSASSVPSPVLAPTQANSAQPTLPVPHVQILPNASVAIDPFADGGPKPVMVFPTIVNPQSPLKDTENDERRSSEGR